MRCAPDTTLGLANYHYMMQYLDAQIGEVINKLKNLGVADNTHIFLVGDNGADPDISVNYKGSSIKNGDFRATRA